MSTPSLIAIEENMGEVVLNRQPTLIKYLEKFLIVKPKNLKIEDLFNKESVAA